PSVTRLCEAFPDQIAAVIVEPVAGNMGVVLPERPFLAGLREICDRHRIVLIFDEVISGFRVGTNGAQGWAGVVPDLTCLGKIIGDRKSTRLNSSHSQISYAVFCLKKKKKEDIA